MTGFALTGTLVAVPAAPARAAVDQVVFWNGVLLDTFRQAGGAPGPLARGAAMMFRAMEGANGQEQVTGSTVNRSAAMASAAHHVLIKVFNSTDFPGVTMNFASKYNEALAAAGSGNSGAPIDFGKRNADLVMAERSGDGSANSTPYTPGTERGAWQRTGGSNCDTAAKTGTPNWGKVRPFALNSGSQFRPPFPGGATSYSQVLNSTAYRDAVGEVRLFGGITSTVRTDPETQTAWFWANDTNGTYKPPGQLLDHTRIIAVDPNRNLSQDLKVILFSRLATALADAAVAAWDTKFQTPIDLWRPAHAVNDSYPTANWRPLADSRTDPPAPDTPCFPAWVSGHATFAGAWAGVLRQRLDTDSVTFTGGTDDPKARGVTRTYTSLTQAARENAISRLYLGVHFRFDGDADGLNLGENVADKVISEADAPRIVAANSNQGDIFCQLPWLASSYGPLAQCTQINGTATQARSGLFSPLTKEFNPGAWLDITQNQIVKVNNCAGSDGIQGTRCVGYPVVNTAYGGAARATQYQATRARHGWFNVVTGKFHPDTANGGWFSL